MDKGKLAARTRGIDGRGLTAEFQSLDRVRPVETGQTFDQGGLDRADVTEKAENLSQFEIERNAVQHRRRAEGFAHPDDAQSRPGRGAVVHWGRPHSSAKPAIWASP